MAIESLILFGILIFSSFWISGCKGKKKKPKNAPPGKSTETAKPLIVAEKKTEDTLKSRKSTKSKVDQPKSENKDEKEKSKKSEKKIDEDEEKKENEKKKKDEKGSEMKKDESKVEEKKEEEKKEDEDKKEEKKDDKKKEKKEEKKENKEEDKKPEEKKDEKKSDENPGGSEKPYISADPLGPLSFKADQSSQSKVTLKNIHDKKIMFKIKLSDNVSFQVNPVFGVLEPGKTVDVAVTHRKSTPKEGKLVVVNTELTGDEQKVAELFKQVTKPTGGQVTVKWSAK